MYKVEKVPLSIIFPKMATIPTNVTVEFGFVNLGLDLDLDSTSGSDDSTNFE